MSAKPGDRVGAILSADRDTVKLLGYGVYQGREVPPAEVGGFNLGFPNPKIVLDNGDVVWGCECWWGAEAQIKDRVATYENVVIVCIADCRQATVEESAHDRT